MKATWMPPGTTIFHQFSITRSNTKRYKKTSSVAMFPELQDKTFDYHPAITFGHRLAARDSRE